MGNGHMRIRRRDFVGLIGTVAAWPKRLFGEEAATLATEAPKVPRSLGDLSGPWILFLDNHCVAERNNVTRSYNKFEKDKRNPLLEKAHVSGTVLPTSTEKGHGYRMWYTEFLDAGTSRIGHGTRDPPSRIGYATSDNGILWQKGDLDLQPRDDSKPHDANPQVIHTPWEQVQRRYKLIYVTLFEASKFNGACSSDGIKWTSRTDRILAWPDDDVGNFVWDPHIWDPQTKQYIGYTKMKMLVHGTDENANRRCVGFWASKIFENWPTNQAGDHEPTLVLVPDYIDDDNWVKRSGQRTDFYGLCGFAYESMYLGFLWIFRIVDGVDDGPLFIELVTSHDGVNWRRQEAPRQPILSPPPGTPGTPDPWDGGTVNTSNQPLVEDGWIKLYYGGCDKTHGANYKDKSFGVGLATLRKDRFASLDAKGSPGCVLTRKCLGMTGPLHVNYKTNDGGSLRAEVLDASGKVVRGYSKDKCNELKGDSVDAVVTWKHHTELPNTPGPLQIRFVLQDASLYSFAAGDSVQILLSDSGVLYTFEGDSATVRTVRNKLISDGEQDGRLLNNVRVVDAPDIGTSVLKIERGGTRDKPNAVEIPGTTNLGQTFTLAAKVKMNNTALTRIFTSYTAIHTTPAAWEVVFEVDPSFDSRFGLHAGINGASVKSDRVTIDPKKYHHFAMTYADGLVRLYFDGKEVPLVGNGRVKPPGGGPVFSYYDLRVGQDWERKSGNEQLEGLVNYILVLPRELNDTDINGLYQLTRGEEIVAWIDTH